VPAESVPAETEPRPISFADPVLPLDPEHAARLLGAALRHHHEAKPRPEAATSDEAWGAGSVWSLAAVAEHLARGARATPEVEMPAGPYQGRSVREAAELAVGLVAEPSTGEASDGPVPILPGFGLEHCLVAPDGALSLGAPADAAAAGDRHLDLAAAAAGLHDRFGAAVVAPMVEAYGFEHLDLRRLDAAQLLVAVAAIVGWPRPGDGARDG